MKRPLLLPLLLLGTVSALYLENDAQGDLSQDLEGSGEQGVELALNDAVPELEGEAQASSSQDAFEDEEAMETDPAVLDEAVQCPREEDRVQMQGSTGCQSCNYIFVRRPRTFKQAQKVCRRCYRGNLISIHNYRTNCHIQRWTSLLNQARFWIGGFVRRWVSEGLNPTYRGVFPTAPKGPLAGIEPHSGAEVTIEWRTITSISSLVPY
uniref:Proteoglycan 3 n=1 Tax=Catagonus wagneri TaxID=51154 RepID=A0A8C3WC79_9CETA